MIGVLVSGEGTNLQALIDAGLPISCVASNKPGARALERAERAGIAAAAFSAEAYTDRDERDATMAAWLEEHGAASSSAPATCNCSAPPSSSAFPGGS